jgi:subfamily B ATP-binding cassette protein MsbA
VSAPLAQRAVHGARAPARTILLRLVRYARPYAGMIAVALFCALAYTAAYNSFSYLSKPFMDEVLVPAQSARAPANLSSWIPAWIPGLGARSQRAPESGSEATALASPDSREEAGRRAAFVERMKGSLFKILLVGFVAIVMVPITLFGKNYLIAWTLGRVLVDIQQDVCRKLLALPLRFHHGTTRGDTLSRILNDVSRAHGALEMLFADLLPGTLALLVGVVILISISWQLTLVALLIAPPLLGVIAYFSKRIRKSGRRRQRHVGDVTQRLVEILAGIKVIKAFHAERVEEDSFLRTNLKLFRSSMKVNKNRVLSKALTESLSFGAALLLILVVFWSVQEQAWSLTIGELFFFVAVSMTTYASCKDLVKAWTSLMEALPAAERFNELLDAPGEAPDPADAVRITGVKQGIVFDKVSFSYGREPVLSDVSLEVRAGEMVALVGRTGAGKTTLADLLLRFYDPDSGSISLDGIDLRRISRASLLEHVAVVTQDPFLFAGTIHDNIRYGRPAASNEDVLAAARAAHVDEFVDQLPSGYDTEVGEEGVMLSGGQRQRVTIARAILKNPAILIFDEATSSLDARSERLVQDAIEALLGGRTVFVIAHRLSTLRNVNRIVILEDGRVSRVGTHDELMAEDNLYRQLVALQNSAG